MITASPSSLVRWTAPWPLVKRAVPGTGPDLGWLVGARSATPTRAVFRLKPLGKNRAMTAAEHYFSAEPASADSRRLLSVRLAGQNLQLQTAPGVFSNNGLDQGTAVLLGAVPDPPHDGRVLDLGCGWGPIAVNAALRAPRAKVWAVDINARARELTAINARLAALDNVQVAAPDELPATLDFTTIWSNPPIRIGKPALHALLERWLPRLSPDGEAYLVVGRNLGSDSLHRWLAEHPGGWAVDRWHSASGFRVLRVQPTAVTTPRATS